VTEPTTTTAPITDVPAWLDRQSYNTPGVFRALAELFSGVTNVDPDDDESAEQFTKRCLGTATGRLVVEDEQLTPAKAVATALVVAELIADHEPEIGPALHSDPPTWTTSEIGRDRLHHPLAVRCIFRTGLAEHACIVLLSVRPTHGRPSVAVLTRPEHRDGAREVLERISARAGELNPYRGLVLRASVAGGSSLDVITLPASLTRSTVVVPQLVWDETDLSIRAVRDQHEMLNAAGLGVRRGLLLVGPPGVGKSAVSAVIARELHRDGFTVIYVEARAGAMLLTAVVDEVERWGGPVCLILEDVDLWVRERGRGDSGLSELLQAMDIDPSARILTLASTNDANVLDRAAIRTGRFDSILEIGYPNQEAAAAILAALVDGVPGADTVDTAVVAAALPDRTSGSDIREIVRRAVLGGDGAVSTAALLAEVGQGRYRVELPAAGAYL
jgi:cell division protease FtsH